MILTHICFRFQASLKLCKLKPVYLCVCRAPAGDLTLKSWLPPAGQQPGALQRVLRGRFHPPFLQRSVSHTVQKQKRTIKPQENLLLT